MQFPDGAATGAPRITEVELEQLQAALRAAAEAHGFPSSPTRSSAADFDRAAKFLSST